jgi:hypothetical protein
MPCNAMHPIQNLFLESCSYELQFDMHSYLHKNFIPIKSGCYKYVVESFVCIHLVKEHRDKSFYLLNKMSCEMNTDVEQVENTSLGSITFHSAFFSVTRELLHLVLFDQLH